MEKPFLYPLPLFSPNRPNFPSLPLPFFSFPRPVSLTRRPISRPSPLRAFLPSSLTDAWAQPVGSSVFTASCPGRTLSPPRSRAAAASAWPARQGDVHPYKSNAAPPWNPKPAAVASPSQNPGRSRRHCRAPSELELRRRAAVSSRLCRLQTIQELRTEVVRLANLFSPSHLFYSARERSPSLPFRHAPPRALLRPP